MQRLAVLAERDDARCKALDVDHVDRAQVLAHTVLRSLDDLCCADAVLVQDLLDLRQHAVDVVAAVLDQHGEFGEVVVVIDDLRQLGEVPAVPLFDAHSEGVQVLVQLVQ